MNPLAPPSPQGYPAPFWLLEGLKVLGFVLHTSQMNIWYAGMPLAVLLAIFGGAHSRRLAGRLGRAMPVVLALGINFGIIPLLFTQAVNYQFFFTSSVLIAWPWFSIILLLMAAYYGAYLYAEGRRRSLALAGGVVSAGGLLVIGFFFANNFSLMTNVGQWLAIFRRTAVAGSPTGLALNLGDPTLVPRWLMMLGLAITTTAAYLVLDAAFFDRRADQEYRGWTGRFAFLLYSLGLIWFAATGSWYIFGTLPAGIHRLMLAQPLIAVLLAATAVSPGLPWLLIALWHRSGAPMLAALVVAGQFAVISLNAISRQWEQNIELGRYADLAAVPLRPQWLALAGFLAGLAAAAWISVWLALKLFERKKDER